MNRRTTRHDFVTRDVRPGIALRARPLVLLGPLLVALALATSAAGAKRLGTITIGKIGLKAPVYAGTSERVLALGPGHYAGTALPGAGHGIVGIAAHRVTPVAGKPWGPFRWLDEARPGDLIMITTPSLTVKYRVQRELVVPVSAPPWYLNRDPARETLILTTCTPPHRQDYRLVLIALRIGETNNNTSERSVP